LLRFNFFEASIDDFIIFNEDVKIKKYEKINNAYEMNIISSRERIGKLSKE